MTLSFRLVYNLCLVANIVLLLVTGTNLRFKYSISNWRKCDTGNDEFLMLRAIPIQKCIFECLVRGRCNAVKFLTIRRECGLLETAANMAFDYNTRPCVFIQMADVKHNLTIPDNCNNCSSKQVCNIRNKTCTFEECDRLTVSHTDVLGNMQRIESKVKTVPHFGYTLSQYMGSTRCNSSGEWDNVPIAQPVDCGEPSPVQFANVNMGETVYPSQRTYECKKGYDVTDANDNMTVTCLGDGTWSQVRFQCENTCEPGEFHTEESRYFSDLQVRTFENAKIFCATRNAHVIHIETSGENTIIVDYVRKCLQSGLWIGITKGNTDQEWKFVQNNTNTDVTYYDWAIGQPSGGQGENCAVIRPFFYKWHDTMCSSYIYMYVICEI